MDWVVFWYRAYQPVTFSTGCTVTEEWGGGAQDSGLDDVYKWHSTTGHSGCLQWGEHCLLPVKLGYLQFCGSGYCPGL